MNGLANPSWQLVIAVVVVLAAVRLSLGRVKSSIAKQVAELAESLAIALFLVFLVIRPFVVQAYFIPSGSMRPTLLEGDRILVNKFIYHFREPRHDDIVVFKSPPSAGKEQADFIKRVVGLPGDKISARAGYLVVGDKTYDHMELHALFLGHSSSALPNVRVKLTREGVFVDERKLTNNEIASAAGRPGAKVIVHPGAIFRNGVQLNESYTAEDPDQPYSTSTVAKGSLFVMGDNRNSSSDSRVWGLLDRNRIEGKALVTFWPLERIRCLR